MSRPASVGDVEPLDPDVAAADLELATELRRIVNRLVLVRPSAEELRAAAVRAKDFADRLEALPIRPGSVLTISEAGLLPHDHLRHSPWSGTSNVLAPPLDMWSVDGDEDGPEGRRTDGAVVFDTAYEGPPGHVHGGCVAGMFDELLGRSQLRAGFTGTLTITYRRPTPLLRRIDVCAWVDRSEGRKRWVKGTSTLDGQLLCEAEGLFIAPREGADQDGIIASLNRVGS
ncbi:MAG: thioesterase superfamily protein [Frankiales bacterium]|nr:thioesterase superfamily protein [Frankiales bacterium]